MFLCVAAYNNVARDCNSNEGKQSFKKMGQKCVVSKDEGLLHDNCQEAIFGSQGGLKNTVAMNK